jgi:hypothetical protein
MISVSVDEQSRLVSVEIAPHEELAAGSLFHCHHAFAVPVEVFHALGLVLP